MSVVSFHWNLVVVVMRTWNVESWFAFCARDVAREHPRTHELAPPRTATAAYIVGVRERNDRTEGAGTKGRHPRLRTDRVAICVNLAERGALRADACPPLRRQAGTPRRRHGPYARWLQSEPMYCGRRFHVVPACV